MRVRFLEMKNQEVINWSQKSNKSKEQDGSNILSLGTYKEDSTKIRLLRKRAGPLSKGLWILLKSRGSFKRDHLKDIKEVRLALRKNCQGQRQS